MIVDFEEYISTEKFEKGVLPLMKSTNTPFSYYKEDFEALIILERQPLFFVFLIFVPTGHFTHFPTLEQSMANEIGNPRQSAGEWVVDTIFQTRESDAKTVFDLMDEEKPEKIINFIREELHKF